MSELTNSLAIEHNKAKEKFAYYLLGIDTVSIGFVVANNSTFGLQWQSSALFFSIFFLALSFLAGLRTIDYHMRIMGLNRDYLELFEKIGKDEVAKMQELINRKFARTAKILLFNSGAQSYLFISGVLAYFAFIVLKSLPGTP